MQRLYFSFSILILAGLLIGCAPKPITQPAEVRVLENPSSNPLPEPSATAEFTKAEVVPQDPPASCPITMPQDPPFVSPSIPFLSPPGPFPDEFWFGSDHLWTSLRVDGTWASLPHNPEGYTQKIFWWSDLFSLKDEPEPALIVTGQRLDAKAPPLNAPKATNAYGGDIGQAMLTGVDFPTLGCWKITGKYADAELSFVVWVAP